MLKNQAFTDIHGNEIKAGVVLVSNISSTANTNISYNEDGTVAGEQSSNHLGFNAVYWPSETAKLNGAVAMRLVGPEGNDYFNVTDSVAIGSDEKLADCESYLTDVILPELK